jgi:hypothetical protein
VVRTSSLLESFTHETFAGRLGEKFRIVVDAATAFDAELAEVSVGTDPAPPERRSQFSLVFRGPPAVVHPQRIYRVEHAELGSFEVFLVPIGPDELGMRYEAVFG